ncbi:hypothetical protein F5Y16DRAFT_154753 [Xylariaceae sp. FL0255]|nr:hypothetical protein F5Y16DRAFT_154753 [Xylariaceae sp. FL0255]
MYLQYRMAKFALLLSATLAVASPVSQPSEFRREVTALDPTAFAQAQKPDPTASKAFAGTLIKTADGRCLFVDELSGDFRANLTPIQVAECGSTTGQQWDVITAGEHINVASSMLIVSTLTNACFNFDPRRAAGNQVLLFSCGGRADGGGTVTNSQLFPYNGGAGPLSFSPENQEDSCFTVTSNNVLDIAPCEGGNLDQLFAFGELPAFQPNSTSTSTTLASSTVQSIATATSTQIVRATSATASTPATEPTSETTTAAISLVTGAIASAIPNPTSAVPVSGAGGTLVPTAVAESQSRDNTATRAFSSVSIQSPDGRCLFINPTAGDFRENLIPISLVQCGGTPNEKFDVITAGAHNDATDSALIVSSLMNGCMSFDGRRAANDTVNMFSCGGRADGGGQTNSGQLIPFTGGTSLVFAPESEGNATCIVPGTSNLVSAPCTGDNTQVFTVLS